MRSTAILEAMASAEGSLVEIYCAGMSKESWRSFLHLLAEAGHSVVVTDDGGGIWHTASSGDLVFNGSLNIEITVGSQAWTSNLWSTDVIDLQGDPRQILDSADVQSVQMIMGLLNRAAKRRVIFVPETLDYDSVTPYLSVSDAIE